MALDRFTISEESEAFSEQKTRSAFRCHGRGAAVESMRFREAKEVYGRQFVLKAVALTEAEAQRQRLVGEGWGAAVRTAAIGEP